jgi:predicted metal-binding membrane protein
MALFVAFGVMNVWAMIALAGIVVGEKVLQQGALVARLAGVVCIAIAVAVVLSPSVATAVVPDVGTTMGGQMTQM